MKPWVKKKIGTKSLEIKAFECKSKVQKTTTKQQAVYYKCWAVVRTTHEMF